MTTLTKPTARAASTALAFEHASDLAASADNAIKRMCDIFAALFGIILLTPLWIIVAAMVRLNDGGPAFVTQERVGLNGRPFTMFKFRTMRVDAEELKASLMEANEADSSAGNSIMFKMANDPRITRIGAFLRKTSIDELPQLFNVLRGDMSLVGPRPPLPSEVAQYEPRVMGKFAVHPGLVDAPLSGPQREKTTVRLPFMRTRRSAWKRTAWARTRRSTSWPRATMSGVESAWETRVTSCSMIGPSSRSAVT